MFFVIHRFKIIRHINKTDSIFFCILRKHFGVIRLTKTNGPVSVDGFKGMKHHNDLRVVLFFHLLQITEHFVKRLFIDRRFFVCCLICVCC